MKKYNEKDKTNIRNVYKVRNVSKVNRLERKMKCSNICGEEEWRTAEAAFAKLDHWLSANEGGTEALVMGDDVCFADIVIASCLAWAKFSLGKNSDEWRRICSWNNGRWKRFSERFAEFEIVDS